MRSRWLVPVLAALAATLPIPASASGPWTTLLRAYTYKDLLADGDSVWCATLEAGLLRFTPSTQQFESIMREPGGLSSNRVTALSFDRSRRLWVGTRDQGVSVLAADRTSWRVLNAFDGLPSDSINVVEAQGDTVWIGTSAGVALWNGREISGVLPDGVNPSPFASNFMSGIAVLGDTVWIATHDGIYWSLLSTDLASWSAVNDGLATRSVDAMASDGQSLFVLAGSTVYRLNESGALWDPTGGLGVVRGLSDDDGIVLVASDTGISRWDGTGWVQVTGGPVSGAAGRFTYAVTADSSGRYFAANLGGLLQRPVGSTQWTSASPSGPPGNAVLNVDIEGPRVYVTTYDEGIGRFDGTVWKYWFPLSGMTSDTTFRQPVFPFALMVDRQGTKWVGCWDSALEAFTDASEPPHFTHNWRVPFPPVANDTIRFHTFAWSSAADSVGGRWFGMDSPSDAIAPIGLEHYDAFGAYDFNMRPGTSALRRGKIHALTVSSNGRVWIGYSPGGIDYFDWPPAVGTRPVLTHVPGTDLFDVQGLAAHDTALWVLTTSEVRRYVSPSGAFRASYTVPAGPSAQFAVRPLDVAPDGTLWLGTVNGIRLYKPDGTTQDFNATNSPLADGDVRAIRIDQASGVVWIGTASGMNRYDPAYRPPPPPGLAHLKLRVYPNPTRLTGIGTGLRLAGNASSYRGAVYDINGRLIRRFAANSNGEVIWDGRDRNGALVKPGIYLVRAEAGGRRAVVRAVLLR